MNKKITIMFVIILTLLSSTVLSDNMFRFDVYESNAKIFLNENEEDFDMPIITINGYTYIPLREMAQKANMVVEWDGDESKIMLSDNKSNFVGKKLFNDLFKFSLPDTANVINYDYFVENEEECFAAKISFDENDLEVLKINFKGWQDDAGKFLSFINQKYSWWSLDNIDDAVCAYHCFFSGTHIKTRNARVYISSGENGKYYLHAIIV